MSSQKKTQSGFTFIEVAAVMAVSGVLATASLPMINQFQAQSAANGAQQAFADALAQARTHAVSQGGRVEVCGSSDGKSCAESAWSKGWLVHKSTSAESIAEQDIISAYQFEDATYAVQVFDEKWQSVNQIRFDSQGFNLAAQRLAATVCIPGAKASVDAVLIERTGRVRVGSTAADRQAAAAAAAIAGANSSSANQCNQA